MVIKNKTIFLQRGLQVQKKEKIEAVANNNSTNNVLMLSSKELYNKINNAKKLDTCIEEEYHEFILDNYNQEFKLFLDIDYECNYNSNYVNELYKNFIVEISNYLSEKFLTCFTIASGNTFDNLNKFIINGIYATMSNNPNKISLHVYFTNVIINIDVFILLKSYINNYKKNSNNELIKHIDEVLFRRNTQLRLIYSKKNKSAYYHEEYNYDNEHDDTINNENSIYNYLFSVIDENVTAIKIELLNSIEYNILSNEGIFPHMVIFKSHHFLESFMKTMISHDVIISEDTKRNIKNLKSVNVNECLELNLSFIKTCLCGKLNHKNNHILMFKPDNIIFLKKGNSSNCIKLTFKYSPMQGYEVTEFIKYLDIIRSVDNYIIYWDSMKWKQVSNDMMYGKIALNLLELYSNNMLLKDKEFIANKYYKESKARLLTDLSLSIDRYNPKPHIIAFENGVYDLYEDKFISGEEAKQYIKLNYIQLKFIDYKNMQKDELCNFLENYSELINIIEAIIPTSHPDRLIFEANLSSCLFEQPKETITFMYGLTKSGKSTIKWLLASLFKNLFQLIPLVDFTNSHNPHKPNPWLGNLNGKLVCIASESDEHSTFDSKALKDMTERIILARELQSNNGLQHNVATIIIDTNFKPTISKIDNAICERLAIININTSYFLDTTNSVDEKILHQDVNIISEGRIIRQRNLLLSNKIDNQDYALPLFYLLKDWALKYHKQSVKLLHTPNKIYNSEVVTKMEAVDHKVLHFISTYNDDIKLEHIDVNYSKYYRVEICLDKNHGSTQIIYLSHEYPSLIPKLNYSVASNVKLQFVAIEHLIDNDFKQKLIKKNNIKFEDAESK